MTSTITDDGLEWIGDRAAGLASGPIDAVAVGAGTDPPSIDDQELQEEQARDLDGVFEAGHGIEEYAIEVSGGLEVPADTAITEFGLFAGDVLVLREVRAPVTVNAGERSEFRVPLEQTR